MNDAHFVKVTVMGLDVYRTPEGWEQNNQWECDTYYIARSELTTRKILKWMRKEYLNERSKGRVTVDFSCWPHLEVRTKGTGEPLFRLDVEE